MSNNDMRRVSFFFLVWLIYINAIGQTKSQLPFYFSTQYDKTTNDVTYGNNSWGFGVGVQGFIDVKSKWEPLIDITEDIYFEHNKPSTYNRESKSLNRADNMANVFFGVFIFWGTLLLYHLSRVRVISDRKGSLESNRRWGYFYQRANTLLQNFP
jgi:hypothetical protein